MQWKMGQASLLRLAPTAVPSQKHGNLETFDRDGPYVSVLPTNVRKVAHKREISRVREYYQLNL